MRCDGYINQISLIENLEVIASLQHLFKCYDWNHDSCLLFNKGKDSAFTDSYCIHFTSSPLMCKIRSTYDQPYTRSTREIITLGEQIATEIKQTFPHHYHLKSHFVGIMPGGKQTRHRDGAFYHGHAKRIVVPIITTDLAKTNFDDAAFSLDVGTVYEMNNSIPHWSENNDTEHRVFLFMDLIPPENLQIVKDNYDYTD